MQKLDHEAINEIKNELLRLAIAKNLSRSDIERIKREIIGKHGGSKHPRNSDILAIASDEEKKILSPILRTRVVRTISGVAVIAVMTAPFSCPHGRCVYCPGGPSWNTPQSYTGQEPASMRAKMNQYDPHKQVSQRIRQLEATGHNTDKIDVIVMGGTFNSTPIDYQKKFLLGVFEALNGVRSETLAEAHRINETAKHRCVGLTIETRPDWLKERHVKDLLAFGATRVEVGVQTLNEEVIQLVRRDHTIDDTIEAFRNLRNAGFKITAHMMPGLPGSSLESDIENIRRLYYDSRFIPDEIKIYPTQVIENTPLAKWVEQGKYKPIDNEYAFEVIHAAKKMTPPYVRIKRALRDLPAPLIVFGPTKGNAREIVQERMKTLGETCRCIRCREFGHRVYYQKREFNEETVELITRSFKASGATEVFLSYEDVENDILIGFLRLRLLPSKVFIDELNGKAVVRELHVYGQAIPIGDNPSETATVQHKGYGKRLLRKAESIAQNYGYDGIAVISGVGVREYYRKNGYQLLGPYMTKEF